MEASFADTVNSNDSNDMRSFTGHQSAGYPEQLAKCATERSAALRSSAHPALH